MSQQPRQAFTFPTCHLHTLDHNYAGRQGEESAGGSSSIFPHVSIRWRLRTLKLMLKWSMSAREVASLFNCFGRVILIQAG